MQSAYRNNFLKHTRKFKHVYQPPTSATQRQCNVKSPWEAKHSRAGGGKGYNSLVSLSRAPCWRLALASLLVWVIEVSLFSLDCLLLSWPVSTVNVSFYTYSRELGLASWNCLRTVLLLILYGFHPLRFDVLILGGGCTW